MQRSFSLFMMVMGLAERCLGFPQKDLSFVSNVLIQISGGIPKSTVPSDEDEQHRGGSEPGSKEKKVGCHRGGEDEEGKARPVGEQGQGEKYCEEGRIFVRISLWYVRA